MLPLIHLQYIKAANVKISSFYILCTRLNNINPNLAQK